MVHHESATVPRFLGVWNGVLSLSGADCVFDRCIIVIPLIPFDIVLVYVEGLGWVLYMVLVRQSTD